MKTSISHPTYGTISYEENIWTGKKIITIGNQMLEKGRNKKTFLWKTGSVDQEVLLKGSFLSGVSLTIDQQTVTLVEKPTALEYLLSALPLLLMLVWGNSVALCSIVPVIGGAIGGAMGGVAYVISLQKMRSRSISGKILTALVTTLLTFITGAVLGYIVVFAILASA